MEEDYIIDTIRYDEKEKLLRIWANPVEGGMTDFLVFKITDESSLQNLEALIKLINKVEDVKE